MNVRAVGKYGVTILFVLIIVTLLVGQLLGQPVIVFVETGSMEPTLQPGDGYIAIPTMFAGSISEGDVILFESQELGGGELTTHRVDAVRDDGYITKGDANPFTDQDGAEPIVSDGQIQSVAVQINGELLVIPRLGSAVEGISGVTDSVNHRLFTAVGLDPPDSATFGIGVLVVGLILLVVSSTSQKAQSRGDGRSRGSLLQRGIVIIAIFTLLVILPLNFSMLLPSGVYQYEIVSSTAPSDSEQVIEAGESGDVRYVMQNSGHLPVVVFLEPASDGVELQSDQFYISRQSSEETSVTMHAPEETGNYLRFVQETRYIALLPTSMIASLHAIHPFIALAAINAVVIVFVVTIGLVSLGTGRVRLRSTSRSKSKHLFSGLFAVPSTSQPESSPDVLDWYARQSRLGRGFGRLSNANDTRQHRRSNTESRTKLSVAERRMLDETLTSSPRSIGLDETTWSPRLVQTHLRDTYDIAYPLSRCERILSTVAGGDTLVSSGETAAGQADSAAKSSDATTDPTDTHSND